MNCNKNSELKTNSPRPMLGEENSQFEQLRKLENLVRVHSDYYKYCHSVLARVSRGWNVFAKVDKTILQNVELPFNANEQEVTESEVCACANTNENISLLPMKWEKMSERQMRVKHRHKPSPIFYALNNSCKKSPLPQAGEGNKNCHCERNEAIQEEMVSNRLLRRFTPRNDSNSSENKKKAGVK